jgi:16S rRNA (cytidine1402-2'-O)-methyltransferase
MQGTLYIIATPIGNLGDMTMRAVEVLKEASLIVAEDTRRAGLLLKHFGVEKKPFLSYHKFNERFREEKIFQHLSAGEKVALVTDSGTPGISDPGAYIVRKAREKGFSVIPIPGPSALTASVSVSGIEDKGFVFLGFLGKKEKDIIRVMHLLSQSSLPVVFYESPQRITKTLAALSEKVSGLEVMVFRELTKMHEEILKGDIQDVLADLSARPSVKGEIVVIVSAGEEAVQRESIGQI